MLNSERWRHGLVDVNRGLSGCHTGFSFTVILLILLATPIAPNISPSSFTSAEILAAGHGSPLLRYPRVGRDELHKTDARRHNKQKDGVNWNLCSPLPPGLFRCRLQLSSICRQYESCSKAGVSTTSISLAPHNFTEHQNPSCVTQYSLHFISKVIKCVQPYR